MRNNLLSFAALVALAFSTSGHAAKPTPSTCQPTLPAPTGLAVDSDGTTITSTWKEVESVLNEATKYELEITAHYADHADVTFAFTANDDDAGVLNTDSIAIAASDLATKVCDGAGCATSTTHDAVSVTVKVKGLMPPKKGKQSAQCSPFSKSSSTDVRVGSKTSTVSDPTDGQFSAGTVTLIKNAVGGDGSFDFVTNVPGLGSNVQTAGGTGQTSASNVPAGTYSIVETVPAGWKLTYSNCSDGSPPNALVLGAGEAVTCTFTNTKDGMIIVDKVTIPAASPQSFSFELAGTGVNQAFQLTDTASPYLSGFLAPGTFSVTESAVADWVRTNVTCTGQPGDVDENAASINLNPGEVVTCRFTNSPNGSIKVVMSLPVTGPADESFSFTSSFNVNRPGFCRHLRAIFQWSVDFCGLPRT